MMKMLRLKMKFGREADLRWKAPSHCYKVSFGRRAYPSRIGSSSLEVDFLSFQLKIYVATHRIGWLGDVFPCCQDDPSETPHDRSPRVCDVGKQLAN